MAYQYGFDIDLVERAQAGDDGAREHLLRRLEPMLRAFFIKRIGLKPSVDDLVQNTLLRVHGGLEALKQIKEISTAVQVLIVTAYASVDTAVEAMRSGALNYLTKPVDISELSAFLAEALAASKK